MLNNHFVVISVSKLFLICIVAPNNIYFLMYGIFKPPLEP